jgi:hypothetical protein
LGFWRGGCLPFANYLDYRFPHWRYGTFGNCIGGILQASRSFPLSSQRPDFLSWEKLLFLVILRVAVCTWTRRVLSPRFWVECNLPVSLPALSAYRHGHCIHDTAFSWLFFFFPAWLGDTLFLLRLGSIQSSTHGCNSPCRLFMGVATRLSGCF